ncbi:MAG: hypothetical protein KF870_00885 [Leadbetterella sp.]|nr:hypothetical protein [Leadbetterella sp.]
MVKELNKILESEDFSSGEDTRSLVFICANNQDFDLPFALLTHYPVFETYAEYWEKGHEIIRRNTELLNEVFRPVPEEPVLSFSVEKLTPAARMSLQRKVIKKYLKRHPVKEKNSAFDAP